MNTVILSSAVSAGNHALFAGTRVLYGLAQASHAPSLFAWTTRGGVPLPAMLLTSSFSALCFGSSFIGNGQLWAWLQNLVGVSNQVRWGRRTFSPGGFCHAPSCVCCLLMRMCRPWHVLDRVVVDRDRVVAVSCLVEDARPVALGDEVPRGVDVAVGPSFRGAHETLLNSITRFRWPELTKRPIDGATARARQITAVSAIIMGA
jgi:hypothetical protein